MIGKLCNKIDYWYQTTKIRKSAERVNVSVKGYNENIVCVMTTIPSRLHKIKHSIISMINQSVRPNRIVVYLDENVSTESTLPSDLIDLKLYGVEFRFVKDIGVHTKYYYAFNEFRNSLVITFDDDIAYRDDLIENLVKYHEQCPKCVICSRAHKIKIAANGVDFEEYNRWEWESVSDKPSHLFLATGVGGVLYPTYLFDKQIFDQDLFLKLTPNNDDLWLKCMELKSSIRVISLPKFIWFTLVEGTQIVSLNSSNVHKNSNDLYWNLLMKYFNWDYHYIESL